MMSDDKTPVPLVLWWKPHDDVAKFGVENIKISIWLDGNLVYESPALDARRLEIQVENADKADC